MPLTHIIVIALVQGLTEFLPVSSSGHLILVPILLGWPDQGLAIDVASHVGTLAAVLAYFWRDVARMLAGLGSLARGRLDSGGRLVGLLLAATVPALVVGFLVEHFVGTALRHVEVVAWTMLVFAVVLYVADRVGGIGRRLETMKLGQAILIGLAQVLAFVPGTSRSGITMVAGRLLGFERTEAARFSFLLSIPAIVAAGLWEGRKLLHDAEPGLLGAALLTALFSAVAGFLAIALLMAWLRRFGFVPFVIYRLIFGALLLYLVYSGALPS
ncbi:MAG: undecaprenyl-diphosphate phosphatase [Dongiaceae bacterium]